MVKNCNKKGLKKLKRYCKARFKIRKKKYFYDRFFGT